VGRELRESDPAGVFYLPRRLPEQIRAVRSGSPDGTYNARSREGEQRSRALVPVQGRRAALSSGFGDAGVDAGGWRLIVVLMRAAGA